MKDLRMILLISLLLLQFLFAGEKKPFEMSVTWVPWHPGLNSSMALSDSITSKESFSHSDLGITSKWLTSAFSVTVGFAEAHYFNYSNMPLEYEGSTVLEKEIDFRTMKFYANEKVNSTLNLSIQQINYTGYFVNTHGIKVGLGISGSFFNLKANLETSDKTKHDLFEKVLIAPVPYFNLGYHHKYFQINGKIGEFSTLWFSKLSRYEKYTSTSDKIKEILSKKGKIFHADVSITATPLPFLGVGLGYRNLRATWEMDDSKGDVGFEGVYLQTGFHAPVPTRKY